MTDWIQDPNGTCEDHWIDLIDNDNEIEFEHYWWRASVKFDGCIHLNHAGNVPFSKEYGLVGEVRHKQACDGYTHICDLDDYIARLINLRDAAKKHFKDWPQ